MSEELLINASPQETRIALIENGVLSEVYIERTSKRGLVGNIYKGKIMRVLPGMEAAFVDIGLERAAFLHVSDVVSAAVQDENGLHYRSVRECLHEGQQLLVQVTKNPLGTKGARLSTYVTIPSRFLVMLVHESGIGVSSKIDSEQERARLREVMSQLARVEGAPQPGGVQKEYGYIVRTAAEGVEASRLRRDVLFLHQLWQASLEKSENSPAGTLIYEDLPLVLRVLRDYAGANTERVRIDSRENYQRAVHFSQAYVPEMCGRIEHYPGERPVFDLYNVEDEIRRALDRKVALKSGGYLIIDQTESMTTIDVNTGAYVGHRNLEETIFKTNLEAAQTIARQLRLRNLGGIIIVDFIDMALPSHREQVMIALHKALERDFVKTHVGNVSSLGLVEMTRKRTRESLEQQLTEACPTCNGSGRVRTAETVCYEISREIVRQVRQFDVQQLTVVASQQVIDLFTGDLSDYFAELEGFVGVTVRLCGESMYDQEQYDVVLQ